MFGEVACLGAALLWAAAVVLFRQPIAAWGARAINLLKCLLATALLLLTAVVFGGLQDLAVARPGHLALLALSGLVGLTLGDTALFAAVARIGAHRTLLVQTLAPVFAGLLAITLGERLSGVQLAGAAVVLAGVALVVGLDGGGSAPERALVARGLGLAVLAAFGQGIGVVIAKEGMAAVPVLPATLVRLAAASVGLLLVAAISSGFAPLRGALRDGVTLRRAVPAAFLGTYVAMLLMMGGVALAPATVAAVLLSTSPIFSLVVEAVIDGRRPSTVAIVGTLVAVFGVALLTIGG